MVAIGEDKKGRDPITTKDGYRPGKWRLIPIHGLWGHSNHSPQTGLKILPDCKLVEFIPFKWAMTVGVIWESGGTRKFMACTSLPCSARSQNWFKGNDFCKQKPYGNGVQVVANLPLAFYSCCKVHLKSGGVRRITEKLCIWNQCMPF